MLILPLLPIARVPCSPSPQTRVEFNLISTRTPSNNITQNTVEFTSDYTFMKHFPSPSNTVSSIVASVLCNESITGSTWINTTVSSGIQNNCNSGTNKSTIPKKTYDGFKTGLIVGTVVTLLLGVLLFIVVSLAVVICHRAGRVSGSTHGDTIEVNPAYGVTQALQDAHTPGTISTESAYMYDYPTISSIGTINEIRINEAYGVVYETIAAGHGESHPAAEFQAGDNNIKTKQNEAHVVINY